MTKEEKSENVEKKQSTEKTKSIEIQIKREIVKKDRTFSDDGKFIKEGYQPTDILTSPPPKGNPPSETSTTDKSE
jgi:hypothetical protein